MNKLINTLLLGAYVISGASAQNLPDLSIRGTMEVLPSTVTYEGKPQIIIENEECYNVYDANLEKEFTLPDPRREYPSDTIRTPILHFTIQRGGGVEMPTEDDALQFALNDGNVLETLRYEDRTIFVQSWGSSYLLRAGINLPEKYDKLAFECLYWDKDTKLLQRSWWGNADILARENGGSVQPDDYYQENYRVRVELPLESAIIGGCLMATPVTCHNTDLSSAAVSEFKWSQTLFNNDSEYEVIRPVYVENGYVTSEYGGGREFEYGYLGYKEEFKQYKSINYEIVNTSGNVVARLDIPEGFDFSYYAISRVISTIKLPESTLVKVTVKKENEYGYWNLIWSVNHVTTEVQMFQAPQRCLHVSQSGDNINVDGAQGSTVGLYTPAGVLVSKSDVNNGHAILRSVNTGIGIISDGLNSEKIIIK